MAEITLIPFLATREVVAPLANDPIMFGRSIQSYRRLECQNLSIIADDIGILDNYRLTWVRVTYYTVSSRWILQTECSRQKTSYVYKKCTVAITPKRKRERERESKTKREREREREG